MALRAALVTTGANAAPDPRRFGGNKEGSAPRGRSAPPFRRSRLTKLTATYNLHAAASSKILLQCLIGLQRMVRRCGCWERAHGVRLNAVGQKGWLR